MQDGRAATQRKKWEISCGEMRKLKIINLLKIAVEIFGPKGMRRVDVRRKGESPREAPALAVT